MSVLRRRLAFGADLREDGDVERSRSGIGPCPKKNGRLAKATRKAIFRCAVELRQLVVSRSRVFGLGVISSKRPGAVLA